MRERRLVLILAALGTVAASARADETARMNVLFLVSDDLTNNAIGTYGGPRATPNIDALARRGVRFDRAYCQFPLCNPSRASFMTGLRPDTTRVYENATQFRKNVPDAQSLPQTFRKAGYTVARVGKLYHYGVPGQIGTDGLDDPPSWERVVNPRGRDKDEEDRIFTLTPDARGSARFGGTLSWLAAEGADAEQTDGRTALEVARLLREYADRPFFLACGFFRPHTPYVAPRPYFERHPLDGIELPSVPANHRQSAPPPAFGSAKKEQDAMTDDLRRQAIQAYRASASFMDAQLGIVMKALDGLNLADRTIVVFLSDHGYHLGEHGLWQKMSLFENSTRVPLIILDPRRPGTDRRCARTVELVDLHATLADLCGLEAPKTDGTSLKPLLDDPARAWDRAAFTQVTRGNPNPPGVAPKRPGLWFMGRSIRTERYRYTEWDDGERGAQLYDYETDPGELRNLADAPELAAVRAQLSARLKAGTPAPQ
ncbi:MAG: sulfatase [Isosphaeraceae bacterium]